MKQHRNLEKVQPLVIVGAPRSGTNMLRDVLTRLPTVRTWPCDEINYVWRHGNARFPSDEFSAQMASLRVQRYIQARFDKLARQQNLRIVVEKTCANSLRVDFVDRVLPHSKYIVIRRDGLDTIGSAMERWKAGLDLSYILRKARFVPLTDLPYYGTHYLWNRLYLLVARKRRLAYWGPRLEGMVELLDRYSLAEVCALQWKRCVDAADQSFTNIAADRMIEIAYEDFVRAPLPELSRICAFLQIDAGEAACRSASIDVSDRSVGKGRRELGLEGARMVLPLIEDTMKRHGYVWKN